MAKKNQYSFLSERQEIETALISIKNASETFQDSIDQVTKNRAINISDDRASRAKDYIKAATSVVLAYNEDYKIGKLTVQQQRRVLELVDDVLAGRREFIHFNLTTNCDGMKELNSKEYFISGKEYQ